MTISVWRYAHLSLSVVASVFILIASVTGIILAFEPISNQFKPAKSSHFEEVTLGQTISALKEKYAEVLAIEIDDNSFVKAEVIDEAGNNSIFYINPKTAEKIGDVFKRSELFTFSQTLHRSLFMGKVGRMIMAVTSFLLMWIAISGMILIVRKQNRWKRFFHKIVKENFFTYYHTILGRLVLIPIWIITLTGVYLSLEIFSLLPKFDASHNIDNKLLLEEPRKEIADFAVFAIPLSEVRRVEFPLFEDVEEFFRVEMVDRELVVNQFTGEVLSRFDYPMSKIISHYSVVLHTGRGAWIWSIILGLSAIGILFFIYSGFAITLKRRKSKIKNCYKQEECNYIILVGSEGGTTLLFANMLYNELIKQNKKAFLAEMNAFSDYPKMEHLVVMTSTYGQGEAPTNALKFKDLWLKNSIKKSFSFSVVGFGSLAYPNFCKFAYEVNVLLKTSPQAKALTELHTVNNQSFESFSTWVNLWAEKQGFALQLPTKILLAKKRKQHIFKVIEKTEINEDETFLVRLQSSGKLHFASGDLLAISSKVDQRERLYSIGKMANDQILLSVKKHNKGLISNFLNELKINSTLCAGIEKNPNFHFPKKVQQVVCIATGTGIAPFLGMIENNLQKIPLTRIWGGKTKTSFELYNSFISRGLKEKKMIDLHLAFSQDKDKMYVQDIVNQQGSFFATLLENNGVVMICGSVAMQKGVIEILESICQKHLHKPLSYFQNKKQIRMDCY